MGTGIIQITAFIVFFAAGFYALSCVRFEKLCKTDQPQKIYLLMFLLSFMFAYLCTEGLMLLTVYNGLKL